MPSPVLETLTRSAVLSPASLDPEKGTVDATISTFAPVQRKGFLERLDPAGLDSSALIGAPVLDGHRQGSARDVLGVVEAVRMDGDKLVATIRLSAAPDVASTVQKIREGVIRGVSVGYAVQKWTESTDPQTRQPVKTAVSWIIREVSAVAVPADPGATFRSHDMPKDMNEEGRPLIRQVQAAHNLPEEWATRMAEAGEEISDDEIRQSGRDEAAAIKAAKPAPVQIRTAQTGNDDPAVILSRQTEALACRMMGTAPSEAARPFMGYGLTDHAREALAASGVAVRSLSGEEVLTRAMHGTSDFPELLTGAGNRVLANAYQQAQSPLKTIARQRTAADFRAMSILKLGEFSGLQKVSEHGEIKAVTTGEAKEGYSLDTFGGIFSLSRKALVNNDLGAFGRWGEMMGRAAAETEAAQLLALLTANSGGGVKLSDGVNLFHASHGNLAGAGAAPSETTLSAARLAMRTQKGLDGSTPVNVVPRYVLCGPALETTFEKLLATINPTDTSGVNPFGGKLSLLVEPRISGNGWYVFADPASAPVLEYAYLASAPGPQLSNRDGWEVLGREFRVVLDFGCGATDSRGAYRNAGA